MKLSQNIKMKLFIYKETGLFQFASSIGIARIKYDEMKARGLKPKIKKLLTNKAKISAIIN